MGTTVCVVALHGVESTPQPVLLQQPPHKWDFIVVLCIYIFFMSLTVDGPTGWNQPGGGACFGNFMQVLQVQVYYIYNSEYLGKEKVRNGRISADFPNKF